MTQLQMKTKEYSYDSYGICRFLPETHITPPFVLFIQTFFVKLKVNLHDLGKGQANMSGEPLIYFKKNKWIFVLSIPVTAVNVRYSIILIKTYLHVQIKGKIVEQKNTVYIYKYFGEGQEFLTICRMTHNTRIESIVRKQNSN